MANKFSLIQQNCNILSVVLTVFIMVSLLLIYIFSIENPSLSLYSVISYYGNQILSKNDSSIQLRNHSLHHLISNSNHLSSQIKTFTIKNISIDIDDKKTYQCPFEPYYNILQNNSGIQLHKFKNDIYQFFLNQIHVSISNKRQLESLKSYLLNNSKYEYNMLELFYINDCNIMWTLPKDLHGRLVRMNAFGRWIKNEICAHNTLKQLMPKYPLLFFMAGGDGGNFHTNWFRYPTFVGEGNRNLLKQQNVLITIPRSWFCGPRGTINKLIKSSNKLDWFNDKMNKAVFRGRLTGIKQRGNEKWINQYGIKHNFSNKHEVISMRKDIVELSVYGNYSSLFDTKFIKCNLNNLCNTMPKEYFTGRLNSNKQMKYRYIIIPAGNSIADRTPYQMHFKSVIFKQNSNTLEYWYYNIKPWIHYIPFDNALDVEKIMYDAVLGVNSTNLTKQMNKIAQQSYNTIRKVYNHPNMICFALNIFNYYADMFAAA